MRRAAGVVLAAVIAVGLAVLLPALPAAACSCALPEPVDEATLDEYDVVVTGEVTRNETDGQQRRELEVAVDEIFKGEAEATQAVVTPAQDASCGTDPTVGTEVLFLMTRGPSIPIEGVADDDELVVMACGGHRAAGEASALDPGRPPDRTAVAPAGPAADDDALAPWVVGVGVLAISLGGIAYVRWRAGRRSEP